MSTDSVGSAIGLAARRVAGCCVVLLAIALLRPAYAEDFDYEAHLKALIAGPSREERLQQNIKIKKALENKSLSEGESRTYQRIFYLNQRLGDASIGYYGEIIIKFDTRLKDEVNLFIIPTEDGGLEFVYDDEKIMEKNIYARVSPEGQCTYSDNKHAPERWGIGQPEKISVERGGEGLHIPKVGEILLNPSEMKGRTLEKPAGCEGWLLRLSNGTLWACDEKVAPFQNCIWAVRRGDGGLDLIHAGPQEKGLYASIAADCSMKKMPEGIRKEEGKTYYWGLKNSEGKPAITFLYHFWFMTELKAIPFLRDNGSISYKVYNPYNVGDIGIE